MSTQSTDSQREATPSQAASTPAAPTKAVQVKLVLLGTLFFYPPQPLDCKSAADAQYHGVSIAYETSPI
jgi:hypothetical protein